MAITHPKPTEETPTNHGEGTTPSAEKATRKHGKMFKAGAAGLAALGIAGAAFVAGRGSGESEPQKVTNDAPVAESTIPTNTTETTQAKDGLAKYEDSVSYSAFPQKSGLTTPINEKIGEEGPNADLWRRARITAEEEIEGRIISGIPVNVELGACIVYKVPYVDLDDGTKVINTQFLVNPLFANINSRSRVYQSSDDSHVNWFATERTNSDDIRISPERDDYQFVKIHSHYNEAGANIESISAGGKGHGAANPDSPFYKNGYLSSTINAQTGVLTGTDVTVGAIVTINHDIPAGELPQICEELIEQARTPSK